MGLMNSKKVISCDTQNSRAEGKTVGYLPQIFYIFIQGIIFSYPLIPVISKKQAFQANSPMCNSLPLGTTFTIQTFL
jgi:hypothetical protein